MIPPHLFYQIHLSFLEQNNCTPPRCGELSDYTDSAHTEVEDPSLGCMNVSRLEVVTLLEVSEKEEGCSGLTPTHRAFKNSLWVGTGTEMRTQYLPAR